MRLECRIFLATSRGYHGLPHHSASPVATVSSRSSASCTLHYDASSRHRSNRWTLDVKLEIVQWSRKVLEHCCKEWQHLDASGAVSISVHRGWASWPHSASVLCTFHMFHRHGGRIFLRPEAKYCWATWWNFWGLRITFDRATYCWWRKSGVYQLRLVDYPIIYWVLAPSQVGEIAVFLNHQQCHLFPWIQQCHLFPWICFIET